MGTPAKASASQCPFLKPQLPDPRDSVPAGAVYCRLPSGRVRIPARDELARFCTTGHHGDCLTYRRVRLLQTVVTGLA